MERISRSKLTYNRRAIVWPECAGLLPASGTFGTGYNASQRGDRMTIEQDRTTIIQFFALLGDGDIDEWLKLIDKDSNMNCRKSARLR